MNHTRCIAITSAAWLAFAAPESPAADKIEFTRDIQPILESTCVGCHKPGKAEGKLTLLTRAEALKGGDGGAAIIAGKPTDSPVYKLTTLPKDHDDIMPPKATGSQRGRRRRSGSGSSKAPNGRRTSPSNNAHASNSPKTFNRCSS